MEETGPSLPVPEKSMKLLIEALKLGDHGIRAPKVMIPQRAISVFQKIVHEELRARNEPVKKQINSVMEEYSRRGILRSSMTASSIGELCSAELKIRAHIAWDQLRSTIRSVGHRTRIASGHHSLHHERCLYAAHRTVLRCDGGRQDG